MPLFDTAIRNAKPNGDKAFKQSDEKGLYLLITPSGGKWWRLDYRFDGKRKTVSMGSYPETSLKEARDKRDHARKQLAQGIDPGENRKAVNQHGKITRFPGKSTLNFFHPGVVQPSGIFAGVTWGVRYGMLALVEN